MDTIKKIWVDDSIICGVWQKQHWSISCLDWQRILVKLHDTKLVNSWLWHKEWLHMHFHDESGANSDKKIQLLVNICVLCGGFLPERLYSYETDTVKIFLH